MKSKWQVGDIEGKKTESGYINVSSPALTAFDLVYYNRKIGGLNRIIPILEDLSEGIRSSNLRRTASYQKVPDMQRLGYLLEKLGNEKLASVLYKKVERKPMRDIPISLAHKNREGELNAKWNVILNTELDV